MADGSSPANSIPFTIAGTEVEVEIQMQPMEQQSPPPTGAAHDQALGSHAVLPTTYGVAVASPVTAKPADGKLHPPHEAGSSSCTTPAEELQPPPPPQQHLSSDDSRKLQPQSEEPGSQPLVPASLSSGFSFWNRAPVDVWAHPTMQRYRHDPVATLGEQTPQMPAGSVAADPEAQRFSDSAQGLQQEIRSSKPHNHRDRPSPAYPSDPAYRAREAGDKADPGTGSGIQGPTPHAYQSHGSRHRHHSGQQPGHSEGHGRGGNDADPEIQPAGPSKADSRKEPSGMSTAADASDRQEAKQAAADVMGEDEDGDGQRGDPTPLFPAGE